MNDQPVIACRALCGRTTSMTGTQLCDQCWQVHRSTRFFTDLLQKRGNWKLAYDVEKATKEIFDR